MKMKIVQTIVIKYRHCLQNEWPLVGKAKLFLVSTFFMILNSEILKSQTLSKIGIPYADILMDVAK